MAKPVTKFKPKAMNDGLAGPYEVVVTVKSTDDVVSKKKFAFSILRRSTFGKTFNVGPEPATAGGTLNIVGVLERATWGANASYGPYANRNVQVQFKAVGKKVYKQVKTVKTNGNGEIATTVVANKSGYWRLVFAGNAATGKAVSVVDPVRVTR